MPAILEGLSVSSPIALAALGAVIVPILIHLFNRSRGQLVIVGTLDFVRGAKSKRVTEIKLMHLLLLMLRIVIFVLIALIMAGLSLDHAPSLRGTTVYITPTWLSAASDADRQQLMETGADNLYLIDNEDIISIEINSLSDFSNEKHTQETVSGQLLARLSTVRHDGPVHVFASNLAREMSDLSALSRHDVTWHLASVANMQELAPPVLRLALFQEKGFESQGLVLTEALKRIEDHRSINIELDLIGADATGIEPKTDWLFWLADGAPENATSLLSPDAKILRFSGDSAGNARPETIMLGEYPFTAFDAAPDSGIAMETSVPLWRTETGVPLLSRAALMGRQEYVFHFSLTDGPRGLASQPDFPVVLLSLLTDGAHSLTRHPAATINPPTAPEQANGSNSASLLRNLKPLQTWLAALAFLLWLLERYLSERARYDN